MLTEQVGRILAGALGWSLVFMGVLGVLYSLLIFFGDSPSPDNPLALAISLGVCALVIAIGIYGNPRHRERIHSYLG